MFTLSILEASFYYWADDKSTFRLRFQVRRQYTLNEQWFTARDTVLGEIDVAIPRVITN
jgi:hypothetical protein